MCVLTGSFSISTSLFRNAIRMILRSQFNRERMKETEPRFFDMRKVLIIRFLLLREIFFATAVCNKCSAETLKNASKPCLRQNKPSALVKRQKPYRVMRNRTSDRLALSIRARCAFSAVQKHCERTCNDRYPAKSKTPTDSNLCQCRSGKE